MVLEAGILSVRILNMNWEKGYIFGTSVITCVWYKLISCVWILRS